MNSITDYIPTARITEVGQLLSKYQSHVDSLIDAVDSAVARRSGTSTAATVCRTAIRFMLRSTVVGVATGTVSTTLCWLRLYPIKQFYQIHYGMCQVVGWSFVGAAVLPMVLLNKAGLISKPTVKAFAMSAANLLTKFFKYANPQVRHAWVPALDEKQPVNADGSKNLSKTSYDDMYKYGGTYNVNHTSFLDGFLMNSEMPMSLFRRCLYMGKAELTAYPVFGWLCFDVCEFIKVHYKMDQAREGDAAYDCWKIDTEKQAVEMERLSKFMATDGIFCFATEGRVNYKIPEEVQSPRRGMLSILYKTGRPIFTLTVWGAHTTWPGKVAIGGFPAEITMSLSRFDFPKDLPVDEKTGEVSVEALSDCLRKAMQLQLDHVMEEHVKIWGKK